MYSYHRGVFIDVANGPEGGRARGSFPRRSGGRGGRATSVEEPPPVAANGPEGSIKPLMDIVNDYIIIDSTAPETYSCYLMKKLGKRSYYFGKVSEKRHGPCKIWTKTHDNFYTYVHLPGSWKYVGRWRYTSSRPGSMAAEKSAKWAAAWRMTLCKAGREAFPQEYPTCRNSHLRLKELLQLSEKRRRHRLHNHLIKKKNPVTINIAHSPLVSPEDVSCEWIPYRMRMRRVSHARSYSCPIPTTQQQLDDLAASTDRGIARTALYRRAQLRKLILPKQRPGRKIHNREEKVTEGISLCVNQGLSVRAAAGAVGINYSTLQKEVNKHNPIPRN
ncbi:uncharacterized protein LOC118438940 [Folsomia candida]|uniref:uncharacterized protein LOC118438940 n=1 Tax=Folsomia candida TaxID=158441 RepID=UPI001604A9F0|nr:uncharacterized protein LOC118438940 [Folsomia candida]